jgi:hypothetical protein
MCDVLCCMNTYFSSFSTRFSELNDFFFFVVDPFFYSFMCSFKNQTSVYWKILTLIIIKEVKRATHKKGTGFLYKKIL